MFVLMRNPVLKNGACMKISKIQGIIEAILFASGDPIKLDRIAQVLQIEKEECEKLLMDLKNRYSTEDSGLQLLVLYDSYQLSTKSDYAPYVKSALEIKRDMPLSQAALETLSIIAYNQPATKGFIEQVRGVNTSQTVNTLVEKGLVEEAGRLDVPGKPITYRTTETFMRTFGLNSLSNLPPLPEEDGQINLEEILKENKNKG